MRLPIACAARRAGARRAALVLAGACVAALVLAVVLTAAAGAAGAQAPPPSQTVLDNVAQTYRTAARAWLPRLTGIAQRLFVVLAGLEFVVSGMLWTLKRESLDDMAAKFLLKFTLVAFLLALITSFTYWVPPLVNGFAAAGERAIGRGSTVSPSEIIDIGRETAFLVLGELRVNVVLQDPAMAIFAALAALILGLSFVAVAAQVVLVMVESYVVLGGGVLFLGFAAFRGTATFAENLLGYAVGVGVRIFFLYLIVGIGTDVARSWPPLIRSSEFFGPASPMLEVIGGAVIFAILTWRVPNVAAARLAGTHHFGIAHALRSLS